MAHSTPQFGRSGRNVNELGVEDGMSPADAGGGGAAGARALQRAFASLAVAEDASDMAAGTQKELGRLLSPAAGVSSGTVPDADQLQSAAESSQCLSAERRRRSKRCELQPDDVGLVRQLKQEVLSREQEITQLWALYRDQAERFEHFQSESAAEIDALRRRMSDFEQLVQALRPAGGEGEAERLSEATAALQGCLASPERAAGLPAQVQPQRSASLEHSACSLELQSGAMPSPRSSQKACWGEVLSPRNSLRVCGTTAPEAASPLQLMQQRHLSTSQASLPGAGGLFSSGASRSSSASLGLSPQGLAASAVAMPGVGSIGGRVMSPERPSIATGPLLARHCSSRASWASGHTLRPWPTQVPAAAAGAPAAAALAAWPLLQHPGAKPASLVAAV
mmetsp:Transcript_26875/g.85395  ORF Transcript_26875/g.85395 Transcript_26875/m.85395 type:complete len:394 (+) Transcript_26875:107-1288(+)